MKTGYFSGIPENSRVYPGFTRPATWVGPGCSRNDQNGEGQNVLHVLVRTDPSCRSRQLRHQTRGGRRTGSPPARAGSCKDDQGHRGTGAGSASRHGGGLGRVHPHDRVPGIPLSYRTKLHPAARGQARASYWLRSPSSPAPDKGQRQARSTVDSLFHWRSLSTSDLPPASHQQSLTTTGTLTEAAKRLTWVAGR